MTTEHQSDHDTAARLAQLLAQHAIAEPEFWAFKQNSERHASHGIFQYPAMMVPQLQGTLLDDVLAVDPSAQIVYDPFAGSGTVMVEAMMRGLDIVAGDINPMALLLCAVKSRPIRKNILDKAIERVMHAAFHAPRRCDLYFPGIDKWFTLNAKIDLFRLREAIINERRADVRRFLWVSLAETVRLTSNSRTSTFKMHMYSPEALLNRDPHPLSTFREIVTNYTMRLHELSNKLEQEGLISKGHYLRDITLLLADARQSSRYFKTRKADILMTSPPYGDNQTTVPYGQHSYLPFKWIVPTDFPLANVNEYARLVADAYTVDHLSLGGSRVGAEQAESAIARKSATLSEVIRSLRPQNPELRRKVVVYARDLDASLAAILDRLKSNAFMFWTLGNRRVGGGMLPLADIVRELLEQRQATYVTTLSRRIPGNAKRIALRNDRGTTMRNESILVMRVGTKHH